MTKGKEAGRIQVYVRVRPFTEKERDKKEINAIALHHDHSLIRVLDPRRDTNYFFDGVFGPESSNYEVYMKVGRPLVYAALNGYKGTLLTYGQTGTGKTYTLLSEDGVTTNVVNHCFERIHDDTIHSYKVTCSFLQVYQEKVYDLLNPRFTVELPVREHPKRGVYVANLTQNEVKSAEDVLALLEFGKRQLVMAETKMVRHSSRSHSIMQLIIERRLKAHIAMEQASAEELGPKSPETVHDSIMAVDETINNLLKELKQDRKAHHRRERECLRELMEKELDDSHSFKGDVIVKGKINLCDLAGSERLTKTKAEGVRLTEAKYLNTSLLELGNVIHALARGKKRHVPYRNSTLTRLLQDCLGDNGKTNFIVCIAPSLSEINETKCSLNFGLRAMRIINVARLNVEVDYKVLAERLAKKLEDQDRRHKLEKLEYLREIQRLNSAVTSYEESEHVVNSDTDTLVSVIQNLSKSVQREKEEIKSLQSELTCLKRKVAHSPTGSTPDIEALFLAELMSMQLLTHVHQSEAVYEAVRNSDLPHKIKEYMASEWTQQNMVMNTGYMLNLLDTALGFSDDTEIELDNKEAQSKESDSKNDSATQPDKNTSSPKKTSSYVQNGLKKMFELFVGSKEPSKSGSSEQSKTTGKGDKQGATNEGNKVQELQLISTREVMSRLTHTKEKVEKHVSNLLLSAFGEQLIFSQGNAPQWGVLGRKLSELIMFKRNNIVGMQESEVWSNYENVVSILETCFKYVMIDKALLATMIVIEHMSDKYYPRLPSPGRALKLKAIQDAKASQLAAEKDAETARKVEDKESEEKASPIKTPKGVKAHLEQEINEVFDDTSRLETELFATMEEKARLEDELIVMKDYVNRLKSDMFHLKIERTNLEKEVKKTAKNIVSLSESNEEQVNGNIMDGYRGLRVGELSDVTEASHESISGESENGSQVSEGNEQSAHILKNCLASMAQMYTLMPNQDDDTLTEGNDSDDKDASLSEDDIGDSDEDDIIITKIARGIQDYHSPASSPTKAKKSDSTARKSDGISSKGEPKVVLPGKQRVGQIKETVQSQRTHETFKDLQVAYEDLEDELYHVRGQLSKAQQIIISLENKMKEEKDHWEQIRKLYLEYKDKNDVLEGKVGILREELEKSLRENTFLKDYHQVDVVRDGQAKPYPHSSRSPTRSPSRRKVFDLRNIPSIQNSNRELQIINLIEENTEIKTFNDKLTQEKVLAENLSKDKDVKLKGLETTIRFLEEEKETLKEEIETIHRRKFKTISEPQERLSSAEVELFSKECAQLERELAMERNLSAKLQNDNQKLTKDIEKIEGELERWKKGLVANGHINDEDLTPTNEQAGNSKEKWSRNRNNAFQTVFIDDDFGSEDEAKMKDTVQRDANINTNEELKDLANKLQREMLSMSEYQEALEKEYGEVKEESLKLKKDVQTKEETIKSLENEVASLKKQGSVKQSENHGTFFSRLNMRASPSKLKTAKEEFDFNKKDECSLQDYKTLEEEMNALKRENSDLRQQITKCEQKIAIYEGDLEKAMFKIKQLQEERFSRGGIESTDNKLAKTPESIEMTVKPTAADAEQYLAASDAKLCKTTREIERLKEQLLDKEAEKGLLYDELHMIRKRKNELDKALEEAREARRELQEKMDQMAKCAHFEDSVKELTEKNQKLVAKLQQSEDLVKSLTNKHEKQNEKLKSIEDDLVYTSCEKIKGEFEQRNLVLEIEKAKSDLQQSEQERKMLSTELNEKIEMSANLEIQLMELKCSNECMKSEMEQMKEKKRMESHQNQEKNITRETMEKRLQEAFKTNNYLQSEVESTKEKNNDLNETLSKATKDKDLLDEEVQKLKVKLSLLRVDLDTSATEKKQFESKTKKLEESKKKMEEDLRKLKDSINSLQGDLQRTEKQHEEMTKRTSNLEKELKRKNKELDNKTKDNRRLRKELSSVKESPTTDGEQDGGAEISEVKELRERVEELEKENEDLYTRLANMEATKEKQKRVTFDSSTTSQLSNEIGWDFENETLSGEKSDSSEAQTQQDLSEEVGWDLTEITTNYKEEKSVDTATEDSTSIDSVSIKTDEEFADQHSSKSEHGNMPTIPEDPSEAVHVSSEASMAQICKEKLLLESRTAQLLESKTSHLTKTQMNLENSLSKALKENKQLVDKLHDSQIILQRIKSRVQKLEEQTSINVVHLNAETQTVSSPTSTTASQIGDARLSDSDSSPISDETLKHFMEAESPTKAGLTVSGSKAIVVLTREKKQIARELETLKQKHEDINQKLTEKEEASLKLQQELNLVTTAYEKERESLLQDLETLKKDNYAIKEKLKNQEEFHMSCKDIKQKHLEAERLVTELENDLMRQTEEKSTLKKELQESKNKLAEVKTMEQELEQLRKENQQVQETMGKQLDQYKNENEELIEQLEKRKKSWQTASPNKTAKGKKRESYLNADKKTPTPNKDGERISKDIETETHPNNTVSETVERQSDQDVTSPNTCNEKKDAVEETNKILIPTIVVTSPDTTESDIAACSAVYGSETVNEQVKQVKHSPQEVPGSANINKQEKILEHVITQQTKQCDDAITSHQVTKNPAANQDSASEQEEGETDEEADIEEKLVKILKERQTMEAEVQSMVQEINTLKSKLTKIQLEHENNSAEQENTNLRKQLQDLVCEKNSVDELVKEMKIKNAQLEIELSDSMDTKQLLEQELMKLKDLSYEYRNSDTEKTEYAEKCQKLEEVLSKVVEENSTLYKEVSGLRDENRKLKTSNILELADGCTQVSPTAFGQTIDTPFSEMKKANKSKDETPIINVSSPGFHEHGPHGFSTTKGDVQPKDTIDQNASRKSTKEQISSGKRHLQLPIDPNTKPCSYPTLADMESKPLSASSPDLACPADERLPTTKNVENLENEHLASNSSHSEFVNVSPESESGYGGSKGGSLCNRCHKAVCECNQLSRRASTFSTGNETTKDATDLISTESVYGSVSQDVCTDSSFASVTDFEDISFSSDWVSAEDLRAGRITARGHRGMSKMHRELAEMKCTNTILENELTILRNRNTDYQSQLQKLSGKNNSLKQKLCERSMIVKKAEKEIEAITEDKMRLEVQVTAAKEEVNRVEREKSKLERSLSNTKSENKRLKIDLATVKAESYKNMKTVIKLEAENKKLMSDLEECREELKHAKDILTSFDNASLTSLDERLSCASPDSHEGALFGAGAALHVDDGSEIQPRDRTGLSLELKKTSSQVRREASDQTFPRYHAVTKDLVTSSESDNLSSPEGYHDRQRHTFAQRLTKSQSMSNKGENRLANLSTTQTEESDTTEVTSVVSSDHSQLLKQTSTRDQAHRTPSQMSYDSDMSFPEEREGESYSQSEETEGSIDNEKGKNQQGSIKKMFKRFSKSKKMSKPTSN